MFMAQHVVKDSRVRFVFAGVAPEIESIYKINL